MLFREAVLADIPFMQIVRNAVKENVLSNPALVADKDYNEYLTQRGKGWVCEAENRLAGFAIADLKEHNIWALFVHPDFEGWGIAKQLHSLMLNWYFQQTKETVWLSTAFNTRAEKFYRLQGWSACGLYGTKEIKFEMHFNTWKTKQNNPVPDDETVQQA